MEIFLGSAGIPSSGSAELVRKDGGPLDNIVSGDLLLVSAANDKRLLVRVTQVLSGDRNEVRLGLLDRRTLKWAVGQTIDVEHIAAVPATEVKIRVGFERQTLTSTRFESFLEKYLVGESVAVRAGQLILLQSSELSSGSAIIQVVSSLPESAYITGGTKISIDYASQLEFGNYLTYEDVGGLSDQIKDLREYVESPLIHPEIYYELGIIPPRGVLLYGPPGTGKTHLARALAGEIGVHCITISGPEVVGTRYGETEASLRKVFSEALQQTPSIIIIDEIDAIAPARGASGGQTDARIVTQLLSLLDGLVSADGIVVVATTNRIEAVEPALRRPGRLDVELFIGPPNELGRKNIIEIHSRPMPVVGANDDLFTELAAKTPGFVGADLMALCREAGMVAIRRQIHTDPKSQLAVTPEDFRAALRNVQPTGARSAITRSNVRDWSDVWGLHEAKARLLHVAKEILRGTDSAMDGEGVLLFGEPGSGKTVLGEGLAGELEANLVVVRSSDIYTKWLGESEEAIRAAFRLARDLRPTVLFFDRVESLAMRRKADTAELTSQRVLNELVLELDQNSGGGIVVVATTHDPSMLDASLIRPGRLGIHIEISPPPWKERTEIIGGYLQRYKFRDFNDASVIDELASLSDGWTAAEISLAIRLASSDENGTASAAELSSAFTEVEKNRLPRA